MFPIVKEHHLPESNKEGKCAQCKRNLPSDNYVMCFGGGFSIDRHFHDDSGASLTVIDNEPGQECDVMFCSKECAKDFILDIAENIK